MAVIDIAKRIITLFIILFLIATVNFVLFRVLSEHGVMPRTNDPILIDQINSRYHLKYSLFEQYVFYLWNTMNLDFGISTTRMKGVEISDIIVPYLERSLWMFGIVGALTVLAGVSYEAIASGMKRRGSRMTTHLIALIFLSAPALGLTMLAVDINTRLE